MNINTLGNGDFDWSDGKRAESLRKVFQSIRAKCDDSIKWYQVKRSSNRRVAWWLRLMAIVLGAFAAAIPTIAEMARDADQWWSHPASATIIGIVVGVLLMVDRFIGASSAWMRYTLAETALKEVRDELSMGFDIAAAAWAGQTEPGVEQTRHALAFFQDFLARINQIVRNETNEWKVEFQSALQQTEEFAKAAPRKVEEVVGTIRIANPDRLAGAWTVSINGGPDVTAADDSSSFRMTPGPITVRIKATIRTGDTAHPTRRYTTDAAAVLAPGVPQTITVTLPQT
jgi:hypothetical protein